MVFSSISCSSKDCFCIKENIFLVSLPSLKWKELSHVLPHWVPKNLIIVVLYCLIPLSIDLLLEVYNTSLGLGLTYSLQWTKFVNSCMLQGNNIYKLLKGFCFFSKAHFLMACGSRKDHFIYLHTMMQIGLAASLTMIPQWFLYFSGI